jgi:hypothetical protein
MTKAFNALFLASVLQASYQRWIATIPYRYGLRSPEAFLKDWLSASL